MPPPGPRRAEQVTVTTSDGVRLAGQLYTTQDRGLGCVVAHGFTGSSRIAAVRAICSGLSVAGAGVLSLDLRGHGGSRGFSTMGGDEVHDIAAGVDQLRRLGFGRVAVLGWSMGGSAVLRYAGLGGDADAVVSVSSPGRWFETGTRPMRVVTWLVGTRRGRTLLRLGRRTRVAASGWDPVPASPVEVVGRIAPVPLLLVHGDDDHYFPIAHVEGLRVAAPEAEVWIETGMGHGELATTAELVSRIVTWIGTVTRPAPEADERYATRQPPALCDHESRD